MTREQPAFPYPFPLRAADLNLTELSYQFRNGLISVISTNKFRNDKRHVEDRHCRRSTRPSPRPGRRALQHAESPPPSRPFEV